MKKIVMNFLLFLAGAIMAYEFYVILTQGKIYPVPNISTLVIYSVLILGVMFFALWALWAGLLKTESFREMLPGALLFALGVGFLFSHTILPMITLAHGWPINSYYGHEPNTVIALGELSFGATAGLYGLYGLLRCLPRVIKEEK